MNSLLPFFSANHPYNEVFSWLKQQLSRAGMRVMQTFDLRLTSPLNLGYCPCPNHGTEDCDCQMVVLLVYGNACEPVTLILHGNDGQTRLSIADNPRQRADAKLMAAIQQALEAGSSMVGDGKSSQPLQSLPAWTDSDGQGRLR